MQHNDLGKKLKMLRKQRGYNQQFLADKFSVTRGTISNWEIGRRVPDIKMLNSLALFYDVSMDFLVPTNNPVDEFKELLAKAQDIFTNTSISEEEKIELHNQLMRIYLNSKS